MLTLTVTFRVGTDVDLAQVQVQNRVSQALPRLPEEVRQLGVTTVKSSPNFIMVVHLVSPDNRYDAVYLRNYGAAAGQGRARPASPAWARSRSSAAATTPCGCGSIPARWRPAA